MSRVTKIICDRCRKEITTTPDFPFPWTIEIMPDSDSRCERHLCDECMNEFNGWFTHNRNGGDGE